MMKRCASAPRRHCGGGVSNIITLHSIRGLEMLFMMTPTPTYRPYLLEAKYSVVQQIRLWPQFLSPPLGGVVAYVVLLLIGANITTDFLIRFGVLGVVNTGLHGVGAGAAAERVQGWVRLKRVSPMPPLAYLVGKLVLGCVMGVVGAVAVLVVGASFGNLQLSFGTSLTLLFLLSIAALPLGAIGLAAAYIARPNSSQAILTWLHLLLLVPIFLPLAAVPGWFETIMTFTPSAVIVDMVSALVAAKSVSLRTIFLFVGYTAAALSLAVCLYRRDEGATFG